MAKAVVFTGAETEFMDYGLTDSVSLCVVDSLVKTLSHLLENPMKFLH
jgi:hypothetical protein